MAVTVAILGGGFMGASHANNYAALGERVRVKTVSRGRPSAAQRVADIVGAEVSTDLEAVDLGPRGRRGRHLPADSAPPNGRGAGVR